MKKILTIIGAAVLMQFQSFGHAWTVSRSWCGGFFHQKFEAHAQVGTYNYTSWATGVNCLGQWVGYAARVNSSTVCDHDGRGCSRPRTADCNVSGNSYDYVYNYCSLQSVSGAYGFWGHANATYNIGNISLTQQTSGRGSAGWNAPGWVNPDIAAGLSGDGTSQSNITGEVSINSANQLVIENLTGSVNIPSGQDRYSKIKILVIRENESTTDEEAAHADELARQGIFENVVYSSEISVSKGVMTADGVFSGLPASQLTAVDDGAISGFELNNINIVRSIDTPLYAGEHLTVITLVDGGFDLSSAMVADPTAKPATTVQTSIEPKLADIYPNPAVNTVSCKVFAASDNESISIKAFDITGKELGLIYSGTSVKGYNVIENLDVSGLPQGVQILELKVGDLTERKKITITR